MWDNNLIKKTIIFATLKHKGQEMTFPEGTPYLAHLFGVTLNAVNLATMCDYDVDWNLLVCSAILHDTIEDTDTTFEELESSFGASIAKGVLALSKNPNLVKEEQMKDSIKRIKEQPKEIAIVKVADRMFNLSGRVLKWSLERQEAYKVEAQMICDELGYVGDKIKNELQKQIDNY